MADSFAMAIPTWMQDRLAWDIADDRGMAACSMSTYSIDVRYKAEKEKEAEKEAEKEEKGR